jgi:methyl-accepting chemotaxis protein
MTLTLSKKLYLSAIGSLAVLVVLAVVNLVSNQQANVNLEDALEHTVLPLMDVQSIDRDLLEVRFRVAGVVLDQLPRAGARIHLKDARVAVEQHWKEFRDKNIASDPKEEELVKQVDSGLQGLPKFLDKIDKLYDSDDRKGLESFLEEDWPQITSKVLKPLAQLVKIQEDQMRENQKRSKAEGHRRVTVAFVVFAVAAVLMIVMTFLVIRSIRRPIDEIRRVLADVAANDFSVRAPVRSADEIGSMAKAVNQTLDAVRQTLEEVHGAADQLSGGAEALSGESAEARAQTETLTDQVMQISAAMEELTVSIAEVSHRAGAVAEASAEARTVAHDGERVVTDNVTSTRRALAAVVSTGSAVGELSDSIGKISEVTKVIKEIADQTNLLALNAAIEAARAGEQGRGFAVVADEVRKLAERTTVSTADIAKMIQNVQAKTGAAVSAMATVSHDVETGAQQAEQLNDAFQRIVSATDRLTRLSEEIADGSREQSKVAQQTAQSMEMISGVSERTSNAVTTVAETAKETAATAERLKATVARFRLS